MAAYKIGLLTTSGHKETQGKISCKKWSQYRCCL